MAAGIDIPNVTALIDCVGMKIGPSDWVTVSQEQIQLFAEATGDHQWIHVDPERAQRESPFGQTVAHGYLTLALASSLLPQLVRVHDCTRIINYGIEKLRLKEPVPAGSRLRLLGEIKSARAIGDGAVRLAIRLRWEAEHTEKVICSGELIYVYYH